MFGFPSYYDAPRRYYEQPQRASYDPFGLGYGGRPTPTRRPQPHTSYRNPYGYQYDPRYYQNEDSDEEEEEYTRPQRVAPQQQVRLDHLTPQQKLYLQQQQELQEQQRRRQQQLQQLQQQRQREQEEQEEEEEEEPQHPQRRQSPHQQQQQQKQHKQRKSRTQHQPQQTHPQQPQQPQHPQQPKTHQIPIKTIDPTKAAEKIQRHWRGWQVRRHNNISKLRALAKIEAEVDALVATPINQTILGLNPAEPLPPTLDTYYVGHIPRNVLMLEHELTAKLLALDEISGQSDIVRPRRKALATKIEQILSRVDAIKKVYNTMTPPPNPTPVISTPEDHTTPMETTPSTPSTTTTPQDKKKESESHSSSEDVSMKEGEREEESPSDSNGFTASMGAMDIQDVSEPSSSSTPAPSISPAPTPSVPCSTTLPSSSSSTPSRVPPLKQMCFNLCDSLIKKSLVVH